MNEELQKQLAEVVRRSIDLAEKTGDFVIEQAPDLIQQFYAWQYAYHYMWVIAGLSFALIPLVICIILRRDIYNNDAEPVWIFVVLNSLVFLLPACDSFFMLVKLQVAPKIYIIEHFLK
jgi:hypothetical protein